MQSEHFIFNGIKSSDMSQYLVRMDSGAVSSPFFGGQDIQEDRMKGKLTPYHFGTELEPIEFTIEICPLDKEWTPQLKNELGRWLIHDKYKSFQTADDLGKFYFCIATEMPNFEMYGNHGYIPITFRTNSAFAWSPTYIDDFDLSTNETTTIIELNNQSNINRNYRPKIEFEVVEGTDVQIKNLSNGGEVFLFEGLTVGEIISVDNENEVVISSLVGSNLFAKFNKNWLELVYGTNRLEISGKIKLFVKSCFPILQ